MGFVRMQMVVDDQRFLIGYAGLGEVTPGSFLLAASFPAKCV